VILGGWGRGLWWEVVGDVSGGGWFAGIGGGGEGVKSWWVWT